MKHDANYEAEEGENVLDDKELVPEVADWGEGREIEPEEEGICFYSCFRRC
jgi:hypothetical protein